MKKKKLLSLLMALCLMLTLAPMALAADTSGLQDLIDGTAESGTLELTSDYTITDTVVIAKGITIIGNGHSITINVASAPAVSVNTNNAVELKNVTVNATATGGVGIDLTSASPKVTLTNSTVNASSRGIRFYRGNDEDIFTSASLTLDGSHILNSGVTSGNYANETTVGDTRGIGLYNVENSAITLKNSSSIKGFGYSVNTFAKTDTNGVRHASNTYNISDSCIWGWSAFNIWTVGNTVNLTNCDVKGLNPLTTDGNSFSVIVLNEDIYGTNPTTDPNAIPNVFNITGGSYVAQATGNSDYVEETLFRIDEDYKSEFNFAMYLNEETAEYERVSLYCSKPFTAFVAVYSGMTSADVGTWASTHVTGNLNTVYNWELLAPGMSCYVSENDVAATSLRNELPTAPVSVYEGGSCR